MSLAAPSPENARLLDVRGLNVAYRRARVLHGVDLRVDAGEIVALLGTNGAGKSTLLRAISGIVRPDAGRVVFDGENIAGVPSHAIVARGLVQMPGGRATFPGLSVAKNLLVGATTVARSERAARLADILELFPWLAERMHQRAGTLSGGQQQQLALARTLLTRPKLLMIDELSLGLAPVVVARLLEVVSALAERRVAVLIVEQHVDLALSFASRATFLERGTVRFEGNAADLRDNRELLRSVLLAGATRGSETAHGARGPRERNRRR